MKKTVPFEFFEPGQYLYFDTMRLVQLEKLLGKSLIKILGEAVNNQDLGLDFALAGISIGLKHHYPRATEQFFAEKLDTYFENGGTIPDLVAPILEAVVSLWDKGKGASEKNVEEVQKTELTA